MNLFRRRHRSADQPTTPATSPQQLPCFFQGCSNPGTEIITIPFEIEERWDKEHIAQWSLNGEYVLYFCPDHCVSMMAGTTVFKRSLKNGLWETKTDDSDDS